MTPAAVTAWRKRLGLSQRKAAAALGVSDRTVWGWEHSDMPGEREPELRDRLAMAALALGLSDYHGPTPGP